MVKDRDLHDLLSTGIWTTQRAKSPKPDNSVRTNQYCRLDYLQSNDSSKVPRTFTPFLHKQSPPPPSVEDEQESVAKETNGSIVILDDEEPKFRGAVDQLPIILPVHEHNRERRFVLVPPPKTDEECLSDDDTVIRQSRPPAESKYSADSKAQLDPKPARDELPPLKQRKSRTDLPRIVTDASNHTQSRPLLHAHRSRSATHIDQGHGEASPRDYFSARPEATQRSGDALLTPVIKHATKGRDRAYWNFSAGGTGGGHKDPSRQQKPHSADQKGLEGYARSSHTAGPGTARRLHSDMEVPQLRKAVERHSSHKDEGHSRSRNGPPSPSLDRKRSPPRLSRRETSPARSHTESLKLSRNRSSYHGRSSPPRESVLQSSSDECREHKTRRHHRERRKSTVIHEDRSAFLSPTEPRSSAASKPRSKPPSPLPSPKISQETYHDHKLQTDPWSSPVFHVTKGKRQTEIERPVSPISSGSPSSPRSRSKLRVDDRAYDLGRPRASSRTPSMKSSTSSSKPVNPPLSLSTASLPLIISSVDRKRQAMPPTPKGSLETSPQPPSCWQPDNSDVYHQTAPLTPRHSGTNLEQSGPSVVSYRRYSQDVSAGTLPGLPDCPRKRPRSGYVDWYTLPKHESFNICPSCYDQVFYPTTFRDLLVPASTRTRDKEIACDLGTSPWYRIAWLMTRKYRRTDLRLLQGIHDVSVKHKIPCYGPVRVTRIWYSIRDPDTRRCISNFKVCSPCAESVQVLFPSLTGIFVPLDRPAEARSGQCSLHYAPNRTRFLTYFDILEDTHDRAMARSSAPNLERLVERIDSWAGVEECPKDEPQRHASWYIMAHIPEMTVCEECFLDVVYPELVVDASAMASGTASEGAENSVVRNFYHKPQLIKSATVCQMASPAMRDLFRRACRRDDGIAYLDAKVRDRLGSL
ncbi:hypothetical protein N0V93_006181 [Gnomoniopsis smithogilvyi]|uniref:Uncharacterized protein n=1 Tax=Gnomoniopsis smithogilvyi TaxID=1191159 RepID=A0A9W8YMS4_9PEZI|nr:hypothetical protein N0V93_006181 [Gnomoniopsis smithogilvyi]